MSCQNTLLISLLLTLCASQGAAQSIEQIPRTPEFKFDGVHYAPDGYLYFGEGYRDSRVFRGKPGGEFEVFADGFEGPTDLVMDSHGNLYVSNYDSTYISVITPDRKVAKFVDTPQGPAGMAIGARAHRSERCLAGQHDAGWLGRAAVGQL